MGNPVVINKQRKEIKKKVKKCCGNEPDIIFSDGVNYEFVDGEYLEPNSYSTGPSIYASYGGEKKWIIQCNHCGRWVLTYKGYKSKNTLSNAIKDWNNGVDYFHGFQD